MLVKCRVCQNKIDRKDAYKVVIKNRNHYYCNEEEYLNTIKQQKLKDDTYCYICDIFGYKITNTALFKEIKELLEDYPYTKILAYLQENRNYLAQIMKKDFQSEYARIRYFFAILKNSLHDFKFDDSEFIKYINEDVISSKYHKKERKRSLFEIETEVGEES